MPKKSENPAPQPSVAEGDVVEVTVRVRLGPPQGVGARKMPIQADRVLEPVFWRRRLSFARATGAYGDPHLELVEGPFVTPAGEKEAPVRSRSKKGEVTPMEEEQPPTRGRGTGGRVR